MIRGPSGGNDERGGGVVERRRGGGDVWKNPAEAIDGEAGSRKKKRILRWYPFGSPFGSRLVPVGAILPFRLI